jgi:3-methylcrotonyl-CoA carboxylase alpha subunit
VQSGDEISQFYDPMIAKLIVFGEDRPATIARLRDALRQQAVFGVQTNASLLLAITDHPAFYEGQTYTNFLETYSLLETPQEAQQLDPYALYAAALLDMGSGSASNDTQNGTLQAHNPWQTLGGWRIFGEARSITYTYNGQSYHVALSPSPEQPGAWQVRIPGGPVRELGFSRGNNGFMLIRQGAEQTRAYAQHVGNETQVILNGRLYRFVRPQPPDVDIAAHGGSGASAQKTLTAPMAGTIVKVQVREGEQVQQRQVLAILTAMKMEHSIVAPYAGKVRRVHYHEGDVVKGGAVIIEME